MGAHRLLQDLHMAAQVKLFRQPDPGNAKNIAPAINPCFVPIVTAGAETRTVPVPIAEGLVLVLYGRTLAGACTVTVTGGYDADGSTGFVLASAGDFAVLVSIEAAANTYRWRLVKGDFASDIEGIGAAATGLSAVETTAGLIHKTVLTGSAFAVGTVGDEAGQGQFVGKKVYDFPAGLILFLGATVEGTVTLTTPAINNWDGDVGLGVEAPTDHQDAANKTGSVMQKNDVSAGTSDKIGVVSAKTLATALTESGARWLDGTGTAIDLFLNFLVDDNAAHDNTIKAAFTGTITFHWINLGDLA